MNVAPQSFGNLLNAHAHLHSVSSLLEEKTDQYSDKYDFSVLAAPSSSRTAARELRRRFCGAALGCD
jgi:hypothetical protein